MITFYSETDFELEEKIQVSKWLEFCIHQENKELGDICYIFCDDNYLLDKNIKYLNHNTLTDIISFDYSLEDFISGDIFISVERVAENAVDLSLTYKEELHRVMVHGILHFCGYNDKSEEETKLMRLREDYYLSLRTF